MDQPFEVQLAALERSRYKDGFGFWMEMGLGKTYTALLEFMDLVKTREATRLVVICPNSFKSGWKTEIVKQGIECDPLIFESGNNYGWWLRKKFEKPPVLIVNYEAIRREHVQEFIYQFIKGRGAYIVIDEGIQIKNNKSQQTKAVLEMAPHFSVVRDLTGKPQTQGPHDMWAQLRSIRVPEIQRMNFYVFRNTFCRMGGYMNKKVIGPQNAGLLASWIDPHVFRASKADWTDLPPKMYTIRDVPMTDSQRRQYRDMEEEFVTWLTETEFVTVDMALTKYVKLAQIQFGFLIDDNEDIHELVPPENNSRINVIKEILDEVTGKIVVIYHHRYAGQVLLEGLIGYNPTFLRGGMTPQEQEDHKWRFNNDPNCRVIVVQDTVGKYGHTLVGTPKDPCSTMVFAENTWSLDTRSQIEDRIHRHGQVGESCLYIDLVSSPLDRRIARALQEKQSIYEAIFQFIGRALPIGLTDTHQPDHVS